MKTRTVDGEITLVPYYPNFTAALAWYQDSELCKQVDNRSEPYDLPRLKKMYTTLKRRGDLFYIKYRGRLCGDVCLQRSGEVSIVVAAPWQNRGIGRRVMGEIIRLAREQGMPQLKAVIYAFNVQSQKMFTAVGFRKAGAELYLLELDDPYRIWDRTDEDLLSEDI